MLSKDALIAKRDDIIRQRDNAIAVHHQAVGALALLDHLITMAGENKPGIKLEDVAEAIGAESSDVSPIWK